MNMLHFQRLRRYEAGSTSSMSYVAFVSSRFLVWQMPYCRKMLQDACIDTIDSITCPAALAFCQKNVQEPYRKTGEIGILSSLSAIHAFAGLNLYDISKPW